MGKKRKFSMSAEVAAAQAEIQSKRDSRSSKNNGSVVPSHHSSIADRDGDLDMDERTSVRPSQTVTGALDSSPSGSHDAKSSSSTKKSKKSARKLLRDIRNMPDVEDPDVSTAHLSFLTKFKKYQALASQLPRSPSPEQLPQDDPFAVVPTETTTAKGLEPLPQPEAVEDAKVNASLGLPAYLAHPTLVSTNDRKPFDEFDINATLKKKLAAQGLHEAFAVQTAVIPLLLTNYPHKSLTEDVLVSASTGSGKTLSYLLPIIESLSRRVLPAIRAVIIVPTRELVTQVRETAEFLAGGSGLRIGTATGTRNFIAEGEQIVGNPNSTNTAARSGVDILITTPGRLVDHIRKTPRFNLSQLKWLVVDEADRLLGQSFQEWVGVLMSALEKPDENFHGSTRVIDGVTIDFASLGLRMPLNAGEQVRKVILSATMTRDVGKLSSLKLKRPRLVVVEEEGKSKLDGDEEVGELHSLPQTLSEKYLAVEDSMRKPLVLRSLFRSEGMKSGVLVFTKSNESAARLGRLLQLMNSELFQLDVAVCNGEMRKKDAVANVKKFKRGHVAVLICTDLISRGMDISSASHVINYDTPRSVRDYVHRVGRTARAGKHGEAWSLVEKNEAKWFWNSIGKEVKRSKDIKREHVGEPTPDDEEMYSNALERLGEEVRGK